MTGKERCLAAVEFRKTDRVPVIPENYGFAVDYCGYNYKDVNYDGDLLAECLIKTMEDFDYDGVTVALDNAVSAGALGAQISFRDDEPAVATGPAIQNLSEVDSLRVSNPLKDGRMNVHIDCVKRLSREIGDKKFIYAYADQGPFALAAMIRGMETFMMDIGLEEDDAGVHKLIDFASKCTEAFMKSLVDAGADVVGIGEAIASPDMLSPEHYEQFAFGPDTRVIQAVNDYGGKTGLHICGNVTDILPLLVQTGVDLLDIDYKTDLVKCHEICAGKTAVRGPIDPSEIMMQGTPEIVREKCLEAIKILGPKGGFILDAGCDIMKVVPHENMRAMVDSVRN
jgi:uroporphyrinogen decarboxylase